MSLQRRTDRAARLRPRVARAPGRASQQVKALDARVLARSFIDDPDDAQLADALHVLRSLRATGFATFDRRLARRALAVEASPSHGRVRSIVLTVPPLATLCLVPSPTAGAELVEARSRASTGSAGTDR